MLSSQINKDIAFQIYQSPFSVFRLRDVALLTHLLDIQSLSKKLNYLVKRGKLLNPRKGIYTKLNYNMEELACSIFTPSYISLEYVLQEAGIVFQYDSRITSVSYLSREIAIGKQRYGFRKIKRKVLLNTKGIKRIGNINKAEPERAFLDLLYLEKEVYFDYLNILNKERLKELLPYYDSQVLVQKVEHSF